MPRCPSCTLEFKDLSKHFGKSPKCVPAYNVESCVRTADDSAGSEVENVYCHKLRSRISQDHNSMLYGRLHSPAVCNAWHGCARGWIEEIFREQLECIESASTLAELRSTLTAVIRSSQKIFSDMHSEKTRAAYNKQVVKVPYIPPSLYDSSNGGQVASKSAAKLSIIPLLLRLLTTDPQAQRDMLACSEILKAGHLHNVRAEVLRGPLDGWAARSHPRLFRRAGPNVVRVPIQIHNDDLTALKNGIGSYAHRHKYSVTTAAVLSLHIKNRHKWSRLMLLSVVESGLMKQHGGLAWALAGNITDPQLLTPTILTPDLWHRSGWQRQGGHPYRHFVC
jgi:hypothetical protein